MKSLSKICSFAPSVRNAETNSGSVYVLTVNECIGPRPLANHKTLMLRISDSETIFSADKLGFSERSHFLTTCGDTPTRLAKTSVSVTPDASMAALNLSPKVIISTRKAITGNHLFCAKQDREKKFSHCLTFLNFSFAKTARVTFLPVDTRFIPTGSGRLCGDDFLIHFSSVPFFRQRLIGNSTGKEVIQ